ncbi:MAG TPA: hypothetical protein VGO50_15910 [Pyrinomonadaceae bacterium]|nr:hypothetical protein [Pyrinomonadaceae bacterium]
MDVYPNDRGLKPTAIISGRYAPESLFGSNGSIVLNIARCLDYH